MYKVAIITNTLLEQKGCGKKVGGGGVVTTSLIDEYSKSDDVDLTVITLVNGRTGDCPFNVVIIPRNTINDFYDFLEKAREIVEKENFDLVITANINELYQNNLLQCHSYSYRLNRTFALFRPLKRIFSRKRLKYEKGIFSYLTDKSTFIAVSEVIKKDYSENFKIPGGNIIVSYPGCYEVYENFEDPVKKEIPVFGAISNSSINKGGHVFLAAMGLLKLTGRKFKIRIIAEKYKNDFLMRFISFVFGLDKYIEPLPKQDDLTDFYESLDCLVLPSTNEAFGLVVIEAAAFRKPSIISSNAGVSEIFDDKSGFVYNRASFWAFFNVLKKFYDIYCNDFHSYRDLCRNAFEVSKKYTRYDFARNILLKKTNGYL